jgi:uncharacterized protein with FMN-binding domain
MRRIWIAVASTVSALVLLFSYRTSTNGSPAAASTIVAPNAGGPDAGAGAGGSVSSAPSAGGSPATSGAASGGQNGSPASGARTVNGSAAWTRFGAVQVQITVSGGKITAATTLQVPEDSRRDQEINSYAVPILNSEAVAAQSARIDTVSGATVTSGGYVESLQAAIDAAHLG